MNDRWGSVSAGSQPLGQRPITLLIFDNHPEPDTAQCTPDARKIRRVASQQWWYRPQGKSGVNMRSALGRRRCRPPKGTKILLFPMRHFLLLDCIAVSDHRTRERILRAVPAKLQISAPRGISPMMTPLSNWWLRCDQSIGGCWSLNHQK